MCWAGRRRSTSRPRCGGCSSRTGTRSSRRAPWSARRHETLGVGLIALKVDVDTLRGTLEGVPRLLDIVARRGVTATFLFSLGPDHTGWALRRVLRPGFMSKVSRTSVVKHYGVRTLLYGLLLPGPQIARRAAAPMRACHAAGHECGIHAWDHVLWQDNVRWRDD